jgi:hypothetical protein
MSTAMAPHMARGRGRPAKSAEDGTKQIKLHADLVEMIGWLVLVGKQEDPSLTAASYVGPLLRPQIAARYKEIADKVEKIKKTLQSASEQMSENPPE